MMAARYFFPLEVIRQVSRRGGLGENHFAWSHSTTLLLRRHLRWLIDLGVPAVGICALLYARSNDLFEHSLGRLLFMGLMLLCSTFLFNHPTSEPRSLRAYLVEHPGGWADRLRYLWYFGITLGPLLLGFNSLSGYHYTAQVCQSCGIRPSLP